MADTGRGQPTVTPFPFPVNPTTEFRNPFGIASAGGFLWFTESNDHNIGKIDTAGNITEIPVGTSSTFIASDPGGGALWFAANGISRITTVGVVTNFPGVGSQGFAFTDGAIWLSQGNGIARADRSNPSPATTVIYPTVEHVTTTYAATKGDDGNIWFIELDHYNANPDHTGRIAKIDLTKLAGCDATPSLCITEYPVPGGEAVVGSTLALGPDQAIWFKGFGKVGRITTSGAITIYDAPGTARAGQLTLGPDNALWYASGKIGRVDPASGSVTEIPAPRNAAGDPGNAAGPGITAGPDGNIWFTAESQANYIGRVNLVGPPPPAPVRGGVIPLAGRTPVVIGSPRP